MDKDRLEAEAAAAEEEGQSAYGKLIEVPIGDLETATLTPTNWVVEKLIPTGVVTLLGGHGEAGKSIVALTIAAHVACERHWAGFAVQETRVCFVSLEDPGEVVRFRLRAIVEHYDLPYELIIKNLRIIDGAEGDSTLMWEVAAGGMRQLMETPMMGHLRDAVGGAGLVFLDNASDAYGGDENQRRQVRTFIRTLADLARENDAGVVLLAHLDKLGARNGTSGNSYSGSTAWHNTVRSRLALLPSSDEGFVELVQEKSNYGRKAESVFLKWADDRPVLVPVWPGDRAEELREAAEADATSLFKLIHGAVAAGKQIPAAMSGPNTAFHELEILPGFPETFQGKPADNRKRVKVAIDLLLRDGRLARVEATTEYRGKRWYLEPQGEPDMEVPF